jgi:magnesium-transporting ATPase (P-type)
MHLNEEVKEKVSSAIEEMANQALRTIGLAYRYQD